MPSPFETKVVADMQDIRKEGLSPQQFTEVTQVAARDCGRLADAEVLYFVIGNYDEDRGQKGRVIETRDRISEHDSTAAAFVLEDVDPADEAWENWYVKFRVFLRRATYVVGVFEDNDGGHELELGEVDNGDVLVLKRDYYAADGTTDATTERERFDGMLAKLFAFLDRRGRLYRWTKADVAECDSLERATSRLLDETKPGE